MLMILGLLAVLLVPLPSLTEGKKVKCLRLVRKEQGGRGAISRIEF